MIPNLCLSDNGYRRFYRHCNKFTTPLPLIGLQKKTEPIKHKKVYYRDYRQNVRL